MLEIFHSNMSTYNRKDHFYHKAKKEGYASRAAYKIVEMDKKFGVFKPNAKIVDLGCTPGGWLQVAEEKNVGVLIGIDLLALPISLSEKTIFIQGDFLDETNQKKITEILNGKADWVLSDMSPNLSGVYFADAQRSLELCQKAFEFSKNNLKPGGGLVMKIFPGPEMNDLKKEIKKEFQNLTEFIPDATRGTSKEVYLVAKGKR